MTASQSKQNAVSFLVGVIFAIGLAFAGMTQPQKIISFLNPWSWDPSLILVMTAGLVIHFVSYRNKQNLNTRIEQFGLYSPYPQWAYTMLSKINNARYDDNFGKPIDASNPEALEYERNKLGLFNALSAVAAFLPEKTVDQIIEKVYTSEEYTTTGLAILAMRAYFIQKVMLKEKYQPSKLTDIGTVEAAIGYNQSIEKIMKLSFAGYVRSDISGFNLMTDLNGELTFDLKIVDMKANWKNIDRGMTTYLKVTQFSTNAQDSRVNAARATVVAGIKAYETAAP